MTISVNAGNRLNLRTPWPRRGCGQEMRRDRRWFAHQKNANRIVWVHADPPSRATLAAAARGSDLSKR